MDIQSLLGHVNAGKRLEKCLLGHDEVALPELLIEQGAVFREIMSQETWASELTDEQRHRLKKLLPTFSKHDEEDKQETLRMLFAGENFKFGNPLKQFQMKLREGFYAPDIAKYSSLCRKAKRKEYKIRQQRYYAKVLQEILLSRQLVLEEVRHLPPDEPPKFHYTPPPRDNSKESRVRRKYIKILKDVRAECEVEGTSSEEDLPPDRAPPARPKKGAARNLYPIPSPEHPPHSVVSTIAPKPLTNGDTHHADNAPKTKVRPVSPSEVTEDDYLHMLRNHKRRRMECLDTPDLDTQEVTLHDILIRCQAIKRVPTKISPSQGAGAGKKRLKARDKPEKRVKKEKVIKEEVKVEDDALSAASSFRPDDDRSHDSSKPMNISRDENEESLSDYPAHEHQGSHISFGKYNNFFCLLRDLINEFDDAKATTAKMEEKVREWQESPSCTHNAWFSLQTNWVEVVVSALKFLSGDALGLDLDNFIPFLDYKERAQQWKWIGAGRDDDTELLPLFTHWLDNKDENSSDLFEAQGSPPPKKVKTNFVVRPTTQQEKDIFKEQEALRFSNPHKAFTYVLHGYESVVGPVKGVYSKDNAMNKAREHTLLVSDRPSYVTILTLVRDAAARLPNGEGTRGDICELLKDSGFIAPGVTDTQINTVVSGALDRLHYEKDPCVKYEVNRKLWVYLHRNRTEEEFEKIHQAQGAAVKAKKSLQKPKSSRTKTKESSAVPQTSSVPSLPKSSSGSSLIGDSPTEAVTGAPSQPSATGKAAASPRAPKQSPKAPQTTPVRRPPSTPSTPPVRTQVTTQPSLLQTSRPPTAASPGVEALLRGSPQVLASQAVPQLGKSSPLTAHGGKPVTISFMQPGGTGQVPVVTQVKGGKVGPAQALSFNLLPAGDLSGKLAAVAGLTADPNTATLLVSKPDTITRPGKGGISIPAAALAQTQSTASPTNRSAPSTPPSAPSPVVARLVQQLPQSQVMSVGNLLQGAVQKAANRAAAPGTLKIQGGGMVQSVGGGKPIHLSGKPLSSAKGLVQISGKPGQQTLGLVQTAQGPLSTLNIISPAGMRPGATITRTDTRGVTSASGTILSSALQTGSIVSHSKSNMLQSQNIKVVSQPQVLSQSQAGIVVTQLAPGSLALRPGLQNLSQAKLLNQSGVLPAQFIVQQAPTGLKASDGTTTATPTQGNGGQGRFIETTKMASPLTGYASPAGAVRVIGVYASEAPYLRPSQAEGGGIGTPIIVSAPGGKPGQNIQLVKTVLSQHAGLKPGQATILISQPNIPQSAASSISPSTQLLQAVTKASKASPKGKGQPVYARIITPPPGMRLANVSAAGQAITASGVSVVPTMAKSAAAATSVTVTTQPGLGKPADSAPSKQ